jgi:hypothetical protein
MPELLARSERPLALAQGYRLEHNARRGSAGTQLPATNAREHRRNNELL